MITVTAPSRLHFGLLSLAAEGAHWSDRGGNPVVPARRFGGAGLMVERPGLRLSAVPAAEWSAAGPLADRALAFARRLSRSTGAAISPHRIVLEQCPPEHAGLGTGTQLGMAVAAALTASAGEALAPEVLARHVGRGRRSALGIHGFARGGFLVDGGKRTADGLAPLVARMEFPAEWRVVLTLSPHNAGWHGEREQAVFDRLADDPARTGALCRLVVLGLLPALAAADLDAFGEALFDFNARSGEFFAAAQGGLYTSPLTAAVVEYVRSQGVRGAGQSSWGPAAFALVGDPDRADYLADRLRARFSLPPGAVVVTAARNQPASVVRP